MLQAFFYFAMLQYIIIMLEIPMKNWRKFLTKVIGHQGKKFVKITATFMRVYPEM